jgi:hypothetical protein
MSDKCSKKLSLQYNKCVLLSETFNRNTLRLDSSIFQCPCDFTLKRPHFMSIKTNFTARGGNMDNKRKWKSFTVSDKINILGEVDALVGTGVELESQLRLETIIDSWMATKIFEDYPTQQDKKVTESCFSLIIVLPTQRTHTELQSSYLRIIHAYKCHCRKQMIWKIVAMIDG